MKEPIGEIVAYRKEQCKKNIEPLDLTYLAENQISDDECFQLPTSCLSDYAIASLIERKVDDFSKYCKIILKTRNFTKKSRLEI